MSTITDKHMRIVLEIFNELQLSVDAQRVQDCPRPILELICLMQKLSLRFYQQPSDIDAQIARLLNDYESSLYERHRLIDENIALKAQLLQMEALLTQKAHTLH